MLGCGFLIALLLAWPTMGLSLLAWLVIVYFSIRSDRRLNELRDMRHIDAPFPREPRQSVISDGLEGTLQRLSDIPRDQAAAVFHELDVTYDGYPTDVEVAAGCLKDSIRFGLENVSALSDHMMQIATAARQRRLTKSVEEAGLRSILCWCIENAARADRDRFLCVDIARASRNGAKADRVMLGF